MPGRRREARRKEIEAEEARSEGGGLLLALLDWVLQIKLSFLTNSTLRRFDHSRQDLCLPNWTWDLCFVFGDAQTRRVLDQFTYISAPAGESW